MGQYHDQYFHAASCSRCLTFERETSELIWNPASCKTAWVHSFSLRISLFVLVKAFAENDCFNRPFFFLSILSKYGRRLFIIKSRHYSIRHSTLYSITGNFWIMSLVFFCDFIITFPDMANSWLTLQVLVELWSSCPSAWVLPGKKLDRGRIAGQYKRWGSAWVVVLGAVVKHPPI